MSDEQTPVFAFVVAEVTMTPFIVESSHATADEAKTSIGALHENGNWEVYAVGRDQLIVAGEPAVVVERQRGGARVDGVAVADVTAWDRS